MKTLTVHRKSFYVPPTTFKREGKLIHRKGYTVKATTYKIEDRGKPGKGPKLIPIKRGKLAPYSTAMPTGKRRKILKKKVKRFGATSVYRSLKAQVIFRKRMRKGAKKVFKADADWLKKKHKIGKKGERGRNRMPRGRRRKICKKTGKKPTHPRKHKHWR